VCIHSCIYAWLKWAKNEFLVWCSSKPESPLLVEDNHTAGLIKNREQEEVIPYTVPVPVEEEKGIDKPLLSSLPVVINEDKAVDTRLSSSLPICVSLLTGGNNSVYKAFHLLQTNPRVQVGFHSCIPI
jgi:hypothetical protein